MLEDQLKKIETNKIQCIETGILLALTGLIFGYRFQYDAGYLLSGSILLVSLIYPKIWMPLAFVWFRFGKLLGSGVSRILLTIIFFMLVVPMGFIRRMLGKDILKLKEFKREPQTAFSDKHKVFSSEDLKNQF